MKGPDDRHGGPGMIPLPLAPELALCLCCHWMRSGPDAAALAAGHRDETSHATIAGGPAAATRDAAA